ncbi:hypothetical protein EDC04DRAFT_2986074 [Pisolithus marmoratus]|nr:hypothetical protein EDC04DRAFT_2986074 [Pisolithus marmoratus]
MKFGADLFFRRSESTPEAAIFSANSTGNDIKRQLPAPSVLGLTMSLSRQDGIVPCPPSDELDEYEADLSTTVEDEDENHAQEVASWKKMTTTLDSPILKDWRVVCVISATGFAATFAPRVEVYTILVCHKRSDPNIFLAARLTWVAPHVVGATFTQNIPTPDGQ